MTNLLESFNKTLIFEKNLKVMSEHNDKKYDTFFESSTVGIGFVYTVILLAIIGSIYAFG